MGNVKRLNLISLISGLLFYTPIMTLLLLQQNISVVLLVSMQTFFSLAMMVSELPTGVFADKFGQKVSMQVGLLLDALSILLLLLVNTPFMLAVFFAVRGLGVAFRSGSDEALLYESYLAENNTPDGFSKAYGKYLSEDILGFIIATALAGVAVQLFGSASYVPLVILTSISAFIALALSLGIKTSAKPVKRKRKFKMTSHMLDSLKTIKKSRTIFALTLFGLLTLNGEYFLRQSYQPYFKELMVPGLFLGVALALGKLLNFIAIKKVHLLELKLNVDQVLFVINALTGGLFIVFAMVQNSWALVVVFILIQSLLNLEKPVVSDYINQRVESHQRSTVLSGVSLSLNSGQIIARLALAASLGIVGLSKTYILQGLYIILGTLIGTWYLRACGCTHRVKPVENAEDLELAAETA